MLKIIAGIEEATSGEVAPISGLRISYLPQEARFDSKRSIRTEAQRAFADALKAAEHMREIEHKLGTADADEFELLSPPAPDASAPAEESDESPPRPTT